MNHYDELGLTPAATAAEVRQAYLALARRFHPDRLGNAPADDRRAAGEHMARINAAWSVLGDSGRRAAYDARSFDRARANPRVRTADTSWQPFDVDDDAVDPRLVDDTPTGAPTLHRAFAFVPAVVFVSGVGLASLGLFMGVLFFLTIGVVLLALSAASFVLIPVLAMYRSSRSERDF